MRTPNVRVLTDSGARQFARAFAVSLANLAGRATPGRAMQWRLLAARSIAVILCAIVAFAAGPANAAQITYVSVTGNWHDPTDNVAGTQAADPAITNGVPTSIVRWGVTSGTPQSGYDYTTTTPPPVTLPGTGPLFPLGTFTHRNFEVGDPVADVGSARCRARAGRGRSVDGAADLHVQVRPRGNPEQPESVSVSDTAQRRMYGPGDDRFFGATHDVSGRWHRLHVVDGFSGQQRRPGIRIHYARRRHAQHVGVDRPVHVGADSAESAAVAHEGENASDCDGRRAVQIPHHGAGNAAHRRVVRRTRPRRSRRFCRRHGIRRCDEGFGSG